MQEVRIHKFETHYRLPKQAMAERRRLDQVRALVLDTALELALERAGVPQDGELCIRNLVAPIRLRLSATDASLAQDWSLGLAQQISRALRDGTSPNMVFYYSRRQALIDLLIRVSRGDLRRVWAWRQLGLWRSTDSANESGAVPELTRSLCAEPSMVVPALRAMADEGGLQHIANRLTGREWEALAFAAMSASGAAHLLPAADHAPSSRGLRDALGVLDRSRLLRAITSSCAFSEASVEARRAVAALAVLDAEPMLLRTGSAQIVIGVIAEAIRSMRLEPMNASREQLTIGPSASTERPQLSPADSLVRTREAESVDAYPVSEPDNEKTKSASTERSQLSPADSLVRTREAEFVDAYAVSEPDDEKTKPASTERPQLSPADSLVRPRKAESVDAYAVVEPSDAVVEPDDEKTKPIDLRRRAFTRFGGLLFLLGLIEDLGLPDEIIANAWLCARPFSWVTHQLALALLTIEPNDPAALAFAGLPPDARPPLEEQGAPNEIEAREVNALAAHIVERLSELLDFEDASRVSLLEFACCRRAEIVADPGWIDVRFSLDDLSTEIRRAGLDLDPGYLSWLGVVVRFVYE